MKHTKHILLMAALLLGSLSVSAEKVEIGGIWYNLDAEAMEAKVASSGGAEYSGSITIPATVTYEDEAYSVTSIGLFAFKGCENLTDITILAGVKVIGSYAFDNCYNLTSVTLPESVNVISNDAFSSCYNLTSITIPANVTSIGERAFSGCYNLTSITCCAVVPPTCESSSFSGVPTSVLLSVPENSAAAYQAAEVWKDFTNIVAGAPVLSQYSAELFEGKSLTLIASLRHITASDKSVTWSSSNPEVAVVDVEGNVTAIAPGSTVITVVPNNGQGTSASCAVTVMKTPVASIEELSNVVIYYVKTLRGSWAVAEGGYELKTNEDLEIEASSTDSHQQFAFVCYDGVNQYLYHVAEKKFVNKDGLLTKYPSDPVYFKAGAYENTFVIYFDESHYINVGGSKQMIIDNWNTPDEGNSCTIVPVGEFELLVNVVDGITYSQIVEGEAEVTSGQLVSGDVEIPETVMIGEENCQVTSIGDEAFCGCQALTSIAIPEGVTSIGNIAFGYCRTLASVAIPESVTEIGEEAFAGCWALVSITLPKGVTKIEREAFAVCGLTSITIPEGVTEIGEGAFSYCSSLASITCSAVAPPTCESSSFAEVDTSIPVYVPEESVAAYREAEGWKEFSNIIGIEAGVGNLEFNSQNSGLTFDLMGRCVAEPQKGVIYIVNGRKVVIK